MARSLPHFQLYTTTSFTTAYRTPIPIIFDFTSVFPSLLFFRTKGLRLAVCHWRARCRFVYFQGSNILYLLIVATTTPTNERRRVNFAFRFLSRESLAIGDTLIRKTPRNVSPAQSTATFYAERKPRGLETAAIKAAYRKTGRKKIKIRRNARRAIR